VGANRHYPDGFSVLIGDNFVIYHNPIKNTGLEVYKCPNEIDRSDFIWDGQTQKLTILEWPENRTELQIQIVPGIRNFEEPKD
jgi:hypothetical protein